MPPASDRHILKCTNPFTPGQYQDYIQKCRHFYIGPVSDLRPYLEASGCCDFGYVTNFAKFQILVEI
jgi:hypothetical protein